ncbi:MAG: hypothetical protein JNL21_25735 [Myxococcales bacterium]|nr:hypothetical protein [Myxococcales bacterium]
MVPAVRSAQCVVVRLRQELFGFPIQEVREMVRAQPTAGVRAGVAVDGIESVEPLAPKVVTGSTEPDLEMAIREGSSKLVCLLQTGKLLGGKVLPPT